MLVHASSLYADMLSSPWAQLATAIVVLAIILLIRYISVARPEPNIPVAALPGLSPKESFLKHDVQTFFKGLETYPGPFQIVTGTGPKTVLPNRFAEEIKVRPELDFQEAFRQEFFINYPGFESIRESYLHPYLMAETIRNKLTHGLGAITDNIIDEATHAIHHLYGEESEWHAIPIKASSLELIARLSSRVFLGKPLCRDETWLEIAKNHTVHLFMAARALRKTPAIFRRIAHMFMTHNVAIQRHYNDAKLLIAPEVELRKERAEKAIAAGGKPPQISDTIGWMVEMRPGHKVDLVAAQLNLTIVAINTTTEALAFALMDLCANPELIPELRTEVIDVIGDNGWSGQSLFKLKLLDSFLKESQRLHPPSEVSMSRKVMRTMTLSDGTVLRKGSRITVANNFLDPKSYQDPCKLDARRFLRLRDSKANNSYQHASTSADMFAFGYGRFACPGRFLASNELKIALCHLLLKYEFKMDESDSTPGSFVADLATLVNPAKKLMFRRREEEINLDLDED